MFQQIVGLHQTTSTSTSSIPSSIPSSSTSSTFSPVSPQSPQSSSLLASRPCAICAGPGNGFYFGVLACRACASFFRRSALEKRQYQCRKGDQCQIRSEGMRNSCRACRLRLCIEAGMLIESTNTPTENESRSLEISHWPRPAPMPASSAVAHHSPTKFCLNMAFDPSIPDIFQFAHSLRNLQNGHRALVNMLYGNKFNNLPLECNQGEYRLLTLEEHIHLDRGLITLTFNFLREYFPQLERISNETKVAILKCFHLQLGQIRNAENTIQTFPECAKFGKHMLHPGCAIDRNNLQHFFSKTDSMEEHIRLCIPLCERIMDFIVGRYKPLAINQLEFAAITGLLLYNCVDRFVSLPAEYLAKRNQLYTQLHALLAQRFQGDGAAVAVRFGQLLTLLLELGNLTFELEELLVILKIFLPPPTPNCDVWEEMLNAKEKEPIICGEAEKQRNDGMEEGGGGGDERHRKKSSEEDGATELNVDIENN